MKNQYHNPSGLPSGTPSNAKYITQGGPTDGSQTAKDKLRECLRRWDYLRYEAEDRENAVGKRAKVLAENASVEGSVMLDQINAMSDAEADRVWRDLAAKLGLNPDWPCWFQRAGGGETPSDGL